MDSWAKRLAARRSRVGGVRGFGRAGFSLPEGKGAGPARTATVLADAHGSSSVDGGENLLRTGHCGQTLETGSRGPLGKACPWRSRPPGWFRASRLSQLALTPGMTSQGVSPLSCPQTCAWARQGAGDLELRGLGSPREPRRNLEQLRLMVRQSSGEGKGGRRGVGSQGNQMGGKRFRKRPAWASKQKTNARPSRR